MAAVELHLTKEEVAALEKPYQPHAVRGWLDGPMRLPGIPS